MAERQDFSIEWERQGRLMIGTATWINGDNPPQEMFHRLMLPADLWPEYKQFLLSLGALLDDCGLIDGALALVDEVTPPPARMKKQIKIGVCK